MNFGKVSLDVRGSKTFFCLQKILSRKFPAIAGVDNSGRKNTSEVNPDGKEMTEASVSQQVAGADVQNMALQIKTLQESKEYKALAEDKKIQAVLSDEETLKQIQNKDIAKLFSNPKVLEIMQDGELLKKIFDMNKVIMLENNLEEYQGILGNAGKKEKKDDKLRTTSTFTYELK